MGTIGILCGAEKLMGGGLPRPMVWAAGGRAEVAGGRSRLSSPVQAQWEWWLAGAGALCARMGSPTSPPRPVPDRGILLKFPLVLRPIGLVSTAKELGFHETPLWLLQVVLDWIEVPLAMLQVVLALLDAMLGTLEVMLGVLHIRLAKLKLMFWLLQLLLSVLEVML